MPVSPAADRCTPSAPRVSFSPDVVASVSPVGMSVQDIANRTLPDMKFLRLVLGDAKRGFSIDTSTARTALLGVFNLNDQRRFLAPAEAEQVEQHITEQRRPPLAPYEARYRFLRTMLDRACATLDSRREVVAVIDAWQALQQGHRIRSADEADALLGILVMNERLGLLSRREVEDVEENLGRACSRQRANEDEKRFLAEMMQLVLRGRRAVRSPK
ncbi:TPA: hypothetical protein QEL15_000279 [Stenotrophomonas maltophilia]|nr:hypothetical protein [Stenotrophomonas maltophilia]